MRLSREDAKIIRQCASEQSVRDGGPRRVKIEAGQKVSLTSGRIDFNILALTRDPNWSDIDLHDYASWDDFRKLHAKDMEYGPYREVLVDFYISSIDSYGGELVTNIQGFWRNDVLQHVQVDSSLRIIWKRQ